MLNTIVWKRPKNVLTARRLKPRCNHWALNLRNFCSVFPFEMQGQDWLFVLWQLDMFNKL
jgi:hypothetical protein